MVVPDRVVQAQRLVAAAPLVPGSPALVDDDRGDAELPQPRAEPDAALPPADDEQVIRKSRDDGFAGTSLGQRLESHKVHRIVIGGLLSEMCVSATARTALSLGFEVVLPHDAHGTYDVDGIPASVVARVAEHALGDGIELAGSSAEVRFTSSRG